MYYKAMVKKKSKGNGGGSTVDVECVVLQIQQKGNEVKKIKQAEGMRTRGWGIWGWRVGGGG